MKREMKMEEYIKNEKRLKKNIEVLENTFLSAGFELKNIGVQYAQMIGGAGIKFYCEIFIRLQSGQKCYRLIMARVQSATVLILLKVIYHLIVNLILSSHIEI